MSTENVLRANVRELQEQVSRLQARLAEVIAERDAVLAEIEQLKCIPEFSDEALLTKANAAAIVAMGTDGTPDSKRLLRGFAVRVLMAWGSEDGMYKAFRDNVQGAASAPTGRMLFWQDHPYSDYPIHDDEESMAEQFIADMGDDMVADFKVNRAVELDPRMMRVYAPTDDESLPRWEWLP